MASAWLLQHYHTVITQPPYHHGDDCVGLVPPSTPLISNTWSRCRTRAPTPFHPPRPFTPQSSIRVHPACAPTTQIRLRAAHHSPSRNPHFASTTKYNEGSPFQWPARRIKIHWTWAVVTALGPTFGVRSRRRETIDHFMYECPAFREQREKMDTALGPRKRDLKASMKNKADLKAIATYMASTGRLPKVKRWQPPQEATQPEANDEEEEEGNETETENDGNATREGEEENER
ncbi:hypothetical protein DFP72DRAFT_840287 [Ephemerocybe angulata]|uniref:Uncharacterized protein n=1 Tax=Ephemerocybe angulata TaxID=980116 RepID=A0A8H6MFK3_9AGAR|nr:hypothetical protein DFP72DRAFT_840287 [Tulosesus angulatus]